MWSVAAWLILITLEIVAVGWLYFDGASRGCVLAWLADHHWSTSETVRASAQYASPTTQQLLTSGLVAAVVSWVGVLFSLVGTRHAFRGLRAWFSFVSLTCVALSIGTGWTSIYWHGQQRRIRSALPDVSRFVQDLEQDWPTSLQRQPSLGSYLSYPTRSAHTLVLLTEPMIPGSNLSMTAIEWSSDRTLRMQLAGAERDAWLEWRQDGQEPETYVNGLGVTYRPVLAREMGNGWFLVQYDTVERRKEKGERRQ